MQECLFKQLKNYNKNYMVWEVTLQLLSLSLSANNILPNEFTL